jgi:hypothetical protein
MISQDEKQKISVYINSFDKPAETAFLTKQQIDKLNEDKQKLENTKAFVSSIIEKDNFDELFDKAVLEGRIYNQSQFNLVETKVGALEDMDGSRVDIAETLISKDGERIIMGMRLQKTLGFITDSYMDKDESDQLVGALQAEGIPGPEIDRVVSAMNKNGAVMLQRGVFIALKDMLEEAIGKSLSVHSTKGSYVPGNKSADNQRSTETDELPISFIEYLKNNEKEFDRVEHEILRDEKFVEFFETLKKHYSFYQNLPVEKMAHEVIVRPQLWNKLSPQTKAWVQTLVEKHRPNFQSKIQEVAAASNIGQLQNLKQTLLK